MSEISPEKLILGTVQMGLDYGINNSSGKVSLGESFKILECAFDSGIRILDSAEAYGDAHQVIGAFHKAHPDKIFEIITKLPHQVDAGIYDKVLRYLNELEVSELKALLFHSFESYRKNITNFDVLLELKAQNKIDYIGVSVYTNSEIETILADENVDIIQLPFNLLDNSMLRGQVLKRAKDKGKIIHTRSAFLQGLFFKSLDSDNFITKQLNTELTQLNLIVTNSNISMSHLALNYCLHQETIDNVLIGVDSEQQLKENLDALSYSIDSEILHEIDSIKANNPKLLNPSLWT